MTHSNEDGMSYGWFMIVVFTILLSPFLYITLTAAMNGMLAGVNVMVTGGQLTDQTINCLNWQVLCMSAVPLITLIGSFVWSINQGANARSGAEGMFQAFTGGWLMMILFMTTGLLLTYAAGVYFDMSIVPSANIVMEQVHIAKSWEDNVEGARWLINLAYFILYLFPIGGIAIYAQSILRRTSGDRLNYI